MPRRVSVLLVGGLGADSSGRGHGAAGCRVRGCCRGGLRLSGCDGGGAWIRRSLRRGIATALGRRLLGECRLAVAGAAKALCEAVDIQLSAPLRIIEAMQRVREAGFQETARALERTLGPRHEAALFVVPVGDGVRAPFADFVFTSWRGHGCGCANRGACSLGSGFGSSRSRSSHRGVVMVLDVSGGVPHGSRDCKSLAT